jgi:energy-coupling factor transporter ATP-binding protein EcfA2
VTQTTARNPFVGLRPFEADDSVLFFGRQQQTTELIARLHESRFVAVVGSSGCGKSSLVRAGLIPRLQAGFLVDDRDVWHVHTMKPGDAPIVNLAAALLPAPGDAHAAANDFARQIEEAGVQAVIDRHAGLLGSGQQPAAARGSVRRGLQVRRTGATARMARPHPTSPRSC